MDFYVAEMLGTASPARCHNYQECETCTFTRQGMTAREKVELQQMKEAMVYDPEKKRVTVSYPVKDPEIKKLFRNNRQQAVSRQSRLWNSLVLVLAFVLWWRQWMIQVWDSLVPTKKWRTAIRNVEVGDIVLVSYTSKLVKPTWRLGRITNTFPDEHGNVREVQVSTRSRKGRPEPPREYQSRPRDEQRLPVQRISVLLPASEVENIPPANEDLHMCDETPHIPDLLTAQARDPARKQVRFQLPEEAKVADTTAHINTLVANLSEVRLPGYLCQDCAQRQSITG